MDKTPIAECFEVMVTAYRELNDKKADVKLSVEAAYNAYLEKASIESLIAKPLMVKVAKAVAKEEVKDLAETITALSDAILQTTGVEV